jgi:hypothetical protein
MSASLVLRRDPRLINKFPYDYYFSKYHDVLDKIKKTFKKQLSVNSSNFVSREKTVYGLFAIVKIINKNFPLLITYGKDDQDFLRMIKIIYIKSFDWLEEGLNFLEEEKVAERVIAKTDHTERLIKQIRKFRMYYELVRDEYFKDIVTKYRVDRHIVSCIDSYL